MYNPLDLNQFTEEDIDFEGMLPAIMAEDERIRKKCKEKYGDDWWKYYVRATNPDGDKDFYEETINHGIYCGYEPSLICDPHTAYTAHVRYEEKMRRLFGPFWKRYIRHEKK